MKIIFSGGGTLGPVTPLLALHDMIEDRYPGTSFLWVGTKTGPEKRLIEQKGIPFRTLAAGKLRRYISIWNIVDPLRIFVAFFQSVWLLLRVQPSVCISAGGYVSVPLHWAAWFLGVPTWIHQQDVRVGLAIRLMTPFATRITTALEETTHAFPKRKTVWLGNPVRDAILTGDKARGMEEFGLSPDQPVIFATGGGTGSMRVNQLIAESIQHLKGHAQVVHLSGLDRPQEQVERAQKHFDYYRVYQFIAAEMGDAYAVSDIVISRGGFGTITELAALEKCAILIPKPGHQVENVQLLADAGAVLLVDEETADGNFLAKVIRELLADPQRMKEMGQKLHDLLPPAEKEKVIGLLAALI